MIKANAPKLELYNGDVGLLVRKKTLETESLQVGDYALFGGKKFPHFFFQSLNILTACQFTKARDVNLIM